MTSEVIARIKLLLADGWTQIGSGEGSLFYKDDLVTNGEGIMIHPEGEDCAEV